MIHHRPSLFWSLLAASVALHTAVWFFLTQSSKQSPPSSLPPLTNTPKLPIVPRSSPTLPVLPIPALPALPESPSSVLPPLPGLPESSVLPSLPPIAVPDSSELERPTPPAIPPSLPTVRVVPPPALPSPPSNLRPEFQTNGIRVGDETLPTNPESNPAPSSNLRLD